MKTVVSGLLTVVLSRISETAAGTSVTEFLHENKNRTDENMINNTLSRESI
jgi:hypothetical protein